jgi:hypothetical protein
MSEFGVEQWQKDALRWFHEAAQLARDLDVANAHLRVYQGINLNEQLEDARYEIEKMRRDRDGWVRRALDAETEVNRLKG